MRIVFSADWYSEGMGYSENLLPAALARLGHEVTVVTSTMQIYGDHDFYRDVYEAFLGPAIVPPGRKTIAGVQVIRLPITLWWRRFKVAKARTRTILALRPDIVYAWDPRSLQTVLLGLASYIGGYRFVSAVHTVASVYPAYFNYAQMSLLTRLRLRLTDTFVGWLSSGPMVLCYTNTPDAAEIAVRFFGVRPEAIRTVPSGLDTTHLRPAQSPADTAERAALRARLGVADGELLCIYTGRFTDAKNPFCLAEAIRLLRSEGMPCRALFLGEGEQGQRIAAIDGCQVEGFQSYADLPSYYRAADIGVWPRQESVSMTDAAACGIPIVASDRMMATERIDGNGLAYRENDPADLARVIRTLADPALRAKLGAFGAAKMEAQFSIDHTGRQLIADFERALGDRPRQHAMAGA